LADGIGPGNRGGARVTGCAFSGWSWNNSCEAESSEIALTRATLLT